MSTVANSHLDWLEAEAIYVLREIAAECQRPVLLFSGGKDSAVLLKLAEKAFRPGKFPFPLMHIDTGHNYPEVIEFRDQYVAQLGEQLIVRSVEDSIARGTVTLHHANASRNGAQAVTLLEAIEEFGFDACIGGARRDEEKARAKERFVSFRDAFGQWDPKNQRPELWHQARTCGRSRFLTGLKWMSGNTSNVSKLLCRRFITATNVRWCVATAYWCPIPHSPRPKKAK